MKKSVIVAVIMILLFALPCIADKGIKRKNTDEKRLALVTPISGPKKRYAVLKVRPDVSDAIVYLDGKRKGTGSKKRPFQRRLRVLEH